MLYHYVNMTFCMFVDCMYYVLRAPRKIGAIPIGLPSLNKVFTYFTYLLKCILKILTMDIANLLIPKPLNSNKY